MRRAVAVLSLAVALALVGLGFLLDRDAASLTTLGALLVAAVSVVDVDKLIGRG